MADASAGQQVFVGVDIGGTKIGLNAIDRARAPISPTWVEVPSMSHLGPKSTVVQIVVGVKAFLEQKGVAADRIAAVGIDSPGPADINGRIEKSANMHADWEGFQLRDEADKALSAWAGRPLHVSYENDCNAAALWESHVGCPDGTEVMALLAPGTGLGGGIVVRGDLLRGARGMGAELGHIAIVHPWFVPGEDPPRCGCGQLYCAEAYASMAALMKILPSALAQAKYKDHPLQQVTGDEVWRKRAYQVRGLAAKGDALCQGIFDWQAEAIGKLCRQVSNTIDPTRIVIGGGFIEGGQALTDRVMGLIRAAFKKEAFKKHADEVAIVVAGSGDQAGCLGAALSAWQFYHRQDR